MVETKDGFHPEAWKPDGWNNKSSFGDTTRSSVSMIGLQLGVCSSNESVQTSCQSLVMSPQSLLVPHTTLEEREKKQEQTNCLP